MLGIDGSHPEAGEVRSGWYTEIGTWRSGETAWITTPCPLEITVARLDD